jgi:hypothetical protein
MSVNDPYDELMQYLSEAKERFAADREGATMTVLNPPAFRCATPVRTRLPAGA